MLSLGFMDVWCMVISEFNIYISFYAVDYSIILQDAIGLIYV